MIPESILEKLVCFTDEEIDHLNGMNKIDKSIFYHQDSNIIDYHQLLDDNQHFSVRKHTRFCEYPIHKHNYIELMYVYGGKMTHLINQKEITIHEGEMLLLNQNIEHSIAYCGENDIVFNFIIRPEFFQFLSTMLEDDNAVSKFIFDTLYSYDNDGEYLVFKTSDNHKVLSYIESIIMTLYKPQFYNELELKFLVGLLLTELMNNPESIESYTGYSFEKVMAGTILKYIVTHYQKASLDEISTMIYQPKYKICKMLKKLTGHTFVELVQAERLKKSAELLKGTHLSMAEIIEEVGYENMSYFYRIFKQKYNMTPQVYRQSYQKIVKLL